MKRIKIMYLITGLNIGGAETSLVQTLKALNTQRFEPMVVSLVGGVLESEIEALGIRTHNLKMRGKWDVSVFFALAKVLKQEMPDILHTHLYDADQLARWVTRWVPVPCLLSTLHAYEPFRKQWLWKKLDAMTLGWVDGFIAVSDCVKKQFLAALPMAEEKVFVIPNGVAQTPVDQTMARKTKREDLGLSEHTPLVGVIGRMELPSKGQDLFLKAFEQLLKDQADTHAVLVGGGPHRKHCEDLADRLGISERVHFVGWQTDVAQWLSAVDVVCLPSRSEGLPMILIEAMAYRCPIVATSVGGVPGLLGHLREALVVEAESSKAITYGLNNVFKDYEAAVDRAQAAFIRYQEWYSAEQVIVGLENLYAAHSDASAKSTDVPPTVAVEYLGAGI